MKKKSLLFEKYRFRFWSGKSEVQITGKSDTVLPTSRYGFKFFGINKLSEEIKNQLRILMQPQTRKTC